ncbi:hypothetical protein [Pandoraea sp. NPDC087047]|uniref:hypothetical protein n=1 Tax=Pandoraea sp. NPDC087047 TaxID=3364390 RepID=UPI00381AA011
MDVRTNTVGAPILPAQAPNQEPTRTTPELAPEAQSPEPLPQSDSHAASRSLQSAAATLDLLGQQIRASRNMKNSRVHNENKSGGTTLDFTKKAEFKSHLDLIKSVFNTPADIHTPTLPITLSGSREGTGFASSYLRAFDRLEALSKDARIADMAAMLKVDAQDLRATVGSDGRGKLEARSTTTSNGTYVTLHEDTVSESSTDPIQTAFCAAREAGGHASFVAGQSAEASVRDLLAFYGVEPSNPTTPFERELTTEAVHALSAALPEAESQAQWGIRADFGNLGERVKEEYSGHRYIAPNKWSPLGQEMAAGRASLKTLIQSDQFLAQSGISGGIEHNSVFATVDKNDALLIHADYFDASGSRKNAIHSYPNDSSSTPAPNEENIKSLRERVRSVGGEIYLRGVVESNQALKYYGVTALDRSTGHGRQAVADRLKEVQTQYLLGASRNAIDLDSLVTPDDQATILHETRAYLDGKESSLLDELGTEVIAHNDETALRKTPGHFLHQALSSAEASRFTKRLLDKLGWVGAKDNEVVPAELQSKLLHKAIALQLEAAAETSGNSEHTLGYQFDQPDNGGKFYSEITADFERHLLKEGLAGSQNSAILSARAYRQNLPGEFAVLDIPPGMRYKTSISWVKFAQGINVARHLNPDAVRNMTFGDVVDLPDQASAVVTRQTEQATTELERQNAQRAKDALDLLKLGPVREWALARGMTTANPDGKTLSQEELNTATSRYESAVKQLVQSYETLNRPLPTRVAMADAELKAAGIDPEMELRYRRQMTTGRNGGSRRVEYVTTSPRDLYMSGEIKTFDFGVQMRDANSGWTPFNNKSSGEIQGLPDISKAFQEKYDAELLKNKQAYQAIVENLLETIPLQDRQAIDAWEVKLFSVSEPYNTRNRTPGKLGTHGFILEAKKNETEKFSYEIFPEAGHIRRASTDTWVYADSEIIRHAPASASGPPSFRNTLPQLTAETTPLPPDSYTTNVDWDAYSKGSAPGPEPRSRAVLRNIGQYPARDDTGSARNDDPWRTARANSITNTVGDKIFLANQEEFLQVAKGQSAREAEISSRLALVDTLTGFIPFYGSVKDLQSDKLSERIMGGAGLFLDIATLGLPIGRVLNGGARAGMLAANGSWKAAQQTLSSTLRKYGPGIASEALVLPDLAKTGIQMAKGTKSFITEGFRHLRGTTEVLADAGRLLGAADPRTWKPAHAGDMLRTLEGVDNVPVRNVGTPDKPEFAQISPTTGAAIGGRYIEVAGDLRRKPNLAGFEATLSPAEIAQMSPRGNGVWDLAGKQYVGMDGKHYESTFSNGERYIKHPTSIGNQYQIERTPNGQWLPLPGGGRGGGKRRHDGAVDSGASGAKQFRGADQPVGWSEPQLATYRTQLKTYGQTDGAIDKIVKAANEGTLTPAQKKYHESGVQAVREMSAPTPASTSTARPSHAPGSPSHIEPRPAQSTPGSSASARAPEPGMPAALARMRAVPRDQWPPFLYHYTSERNFSQMRSDNVLNYSVIDWHTPIKPMGAFMTPVPPNGNTLHDISKSIFPTNFRFEQYRENGVARYFKFDTSKMPGNYAIYKSDVPGSNEFFVRGTPDERMGLVFRGSLMGKARDYLVESGDTVRKGGATLSK